jgi:hypothetical protein
MAELPELTDDVTGFARDAAYVAVGLGVLGYQRVQVQRVALERKLAEAGLEDRLAGVRTVVVEGMRQLDDVLEEAVQFVDSTFETLEQLPPPARDLAGRAHAGARQVSDRLRELVASSQDR